MADNDVVKDIETYCDHHDPNQLREQADEAWLKQDVDPVTRDLLDDAMDQAEAGLPL